MPLPPFVLLAAALAVPAPPPQEPPGETYSVTCRFTNPAYSGECEVTEEASVRLAPTAACSQVLSCLNDPRCAKTYCNATTVRSGWQLVSARKADASR